MRPFFNVFAFFVLVFVFSCKKETEPVGTRAFYMGTTPWPADFTDDGVASSYDFINTNCDMVSHLFADGIPYQEAYLNQPLPVAFQDEVFFRKSKTATGKNILLSIAPLNLSRREKAEYYKESSIGITDSIKNNWKLLSFNDPKVVTAYINYCSYLIEQFNPDFVNYGVESNADNWDIAQFNAYKIFLSQVYTKLKQKYPSIPFFVSFMVYEKPAALSIASELLLYSDLIGLSSYPYTSVSSSANGSTDPANFPSDYFTRFIDLDKSKPFAFAETGYISEDLIIPSFNLNKIGNANWQQAYLEKVCTLANQRRAKFIIWFCHKDYDAGNLTLKRLNLYQDLFSLWEDTGLIDESGKERPSLQSWKNWMRFKKY